MSLSCECGDDGDWWYFQPEDYSMLETKRWRKCCSCKALIRPGDLCLKFKCERHPQYEIEERIYGDEVPMPAKFMCESCADQYFNLDALGFCIQLTDNMMDLLREYREVYASK